MNIEEILQTCKNIAVVGMSKDPSKAAHTIPMYMKRMGYNIIPINPTTETISGIKCYSNINDYDGIIDLVNVFRPSREALGIVEQAIKRKAERGDIKAVWLQLGIFDPKARETAIASGLDYIENRCIYVERENI